MNDNPAGISWTHISDLLNWLKQVKINFRRRDRYNVGFLSFLSTKFYIGVHVIRAIIEMHKIEY